jgi:hypothetical protein
MCGAALDLNGINVVVGAPVDRNGTTVVAERGAVYFFTGTAQRKKVVPADLPGGAAFGQTVSIDPWFLVVGAYSENVPVNDAGAAYVYGLFGPIDFIGGPCCVITDVDARLSLPIPESGDFFSLSLRVETPYVIGSISGRNPSGGIVLYELATYPDEWSLLGRLLPSIEATGGEAAGRGVARAGSMLLGGAPGDYVTGPTGSSLPFAGSLFAWDVAVLKPLFVDGFESGDLSRWTKVQP